MTERLFIGIDLGTSGVKVTVSDEMEVISASASRRLAVHREQDGWNEQHPDDWWQATCECLDELATNRAMMHRVAGIGLSGQMLGPVLINAQDEAIRRVLLWSDCRATKECDELLSAVPDIGYRTNCTPDPGMGAPKLMWLAQHEPEVLDATDCLLLPKDFLRLRLTGERATEPSDAGGTLLMDVEHSAWSASLCAAAGWSLDRLPRIMDSWEPAGALLPSLAQRWHLQSSLPVAAGAGDNMACSLGVGVAQASDCAVTLGTSAVLCTVDDQYRPLPEQAFMTGRHAAPDAYLSMGVVMSATASIDWLLSILGQSVDTLNASIDALYQTGRAWHSPICVPWLNGNRTPHNRPTARGHFAGLSLSTEPAMLGFSIIEGVAFQIRECQLAQQQAGLTAGNVIIVGGGSQNDLWCTLIASLLHTSVMRPDNGGVAACLGAARLARVAAGCGGASEVLSSAPDKCTQFDPDSQMQGELAARFEQYRALAETVD